MTDRYLPPLRDIDELCDLEALAALDPFSHADPATVKAAVAEAGRFMAEVVAPTNRPGDEVGSVRNDDGSVTTLFGGLS